MIILAVLILICGIVLTALTEEIQFFAGAFLVFLILAMIAAKIGN